MIKFNLVIQLVIFFTIGIVASQGIHAYAEQQAVNYLCGVYAKMPLQVLAQIDIGGL